MGNYFDLTKFKSFKDVKRRFLKYLPDEAFDLNHIDSCWHWQGAKTMKGYGCLSWGSDKQYGAHEISYMIHKGRILPGQLVRHTCDNPACVNPKHLIIGTAVDNMHDRDIRERSGSAKLSIAEVREIKKIFTEKYTYGLISKLARKYQVDPQAINDIYHNKTWTWVEPEEVK